VDGDWGQPTDQRAVTYARLAPGSYRFLVQALDRDGQVGQPAVVSFSVLPPVWQRGWFIALALAALASAALALYRLRVRQMRREFALVLGERTRIARDIHDTLAQGFVGISMQLESVRETFSGAPAEAARHLERARELVRESLAEARRSVRELRPRALEQSNLASALAELAQGLTNGKTVILFHSSGAPRPVAFHAEDNLFRIAQEAVTNALKHAGARRIDILLEHRRRSVRLTVRDDGRGFDPGATPSDAGFGLVGMRERAEALGGELSVGAATGGGAEVSIEVKA
jgi:signal transduction histidine kinase